MNRLDFRLFSIWSGAIMMVVVMGGAIAILFTDLFSDRLYGSKRTGFAVLLILYGIYRGFRMRQILRTRND